MNLNIVVWPTMIISWTFMLITCLTIIGAVADAGGGGESLTSLTETSSGDAVLIFENISFNHQQLQDDVYLIKSVDFGEFDTGNESSNLVQLNLLLQHYTTASIVDVDHCANVLFTLDSATGLFVDIKDSTLFNWFGLYGRKLLYHPPATVSADSVQSLVYDHVRHTVYLSENNSLKSIQLCDLQPKELLTRDPTTKLTKLKFDPERRQLFWAESKSFSHFQIVSTGSNLDTDVQIWYESNNSQCSTMAIDVDHQLLYWVQSGKVFQLSYANHESVQMSAMTITEPANAVIVTDRMMVHGGYLYWATMQHSVDRALIESTNLHRPQTIATVRDSAVFLSSFYIASINWSNEVEATNYCLPKCASLTTNSDDSSDNSVTDYLKDIWIAHLIVIVVVVTLVHSLIYLLFQCISWI